MVRKIDSILDRVKDPESDLPISRLGLVRKVRYSAEHNKMYLFVESHSHLPKCPACSAIGMAVVAHILKNLTVEFQAEFPDLSIEIV